MPRKPHVETMAEYNAWMNARLYEAAARLPEAEIARDRGAFFGSLLGTLGHIAVADTLWLKRFAALPAPHPALDPVRALPMPAALDAPPFPALADLHAHRLRLDAAIRGWVAELGEDELGQVLHYRNLRGEAFTRELFGLLMHFFNHQTHHRGQATTLLSQAGIDVGATDLVLLLPQAEVQHLAGPGHPRSEPA